MHNIFISVFVFISGLSIGSFLNVLIDRLPFDRNIFDDRSVCDSCDHKLAPSDLIPLVSYLLLKGKCRYCKAKIPSRIFLVELLTGSVFALLYYLFSIGLFSLPEVVYLLIVLSAFIVIFFTDVDYGIIPDQIIYVLLFVNFVFVAYTKPTDYGLYLISAFFAFLFFLIIFLATRGRGMGFGDVKLAFVLGLFLGFPNTIVAFYVAFLTGAAISLILILRGKKKLKGSTIPFGPFMILGAVIAYFFGQKLIYLSQMFLLSSNYSLF